MFLSFIDLNKKTPKIPTKALSHKSSYKPVLIDLVSTSSVKSESSRFALPSIIPSIFGKASLGDAGTLCSRVSAAQESHCTQDNTRGVIDAV